MEFLIILKKIMCSCWVILGSGEKFRFGQFRVQAQILGLDQNLGLGKILCSGKKFMFGRKF